MGNDGNDGEVEDISTNFMLRSSRTGSFRKFLHSSFRRTRKIFGVEGSSSEVREEPRPSSAVLDDVSEVSEVVEELDLISLDRDDILRFSRISTKTLQIFRPTSARYDRIFTNLKNISNPTNCFLIKYFQKETKTHGTKSSLNSFEKKRRYHQFFGLDHHAKKQLFCPLQASQIEFAFKTETKMDVIIKVQAPNGEESGYISPKTHEYTSFSPSNIGCGHGVWYVHVAVRKGCRFKHVYTEQFDLLGQGILYFEIDNHRQLKIVEKLWLDCLN